MIIETSSISLSRLHCLPSVLYDAGLTQRLQYLSAHASSPFVSLLVDALSPIKVIRFKRKFYPVEWLDELDWLRKTEPEVKVTVAVVKSTTNFNDIEHAICQHHYLRNLTQSSCKDLYGLEKIWQTECDYQPLLTQKDYVKMLGCERTLLNRHHKALLNTPNQPEKNDNPPEKSQFSWQSETSHIPPDPSKLCVNDA